MNWSERLKLAWKTFIREALPLYLWILIYIGVGIIILLVLGAGFLAKNPSLFSGSYFYGAPMPVPGVPPSQGINILPNPFDFHNSASLGAFHNLSALLTALGNITGTIFLFILLAWLMGTAFYTGMFNLTTKAYRGPVTFKDFSYTGFFRILGWRGILLLIEIVIITIWIIGALAFKGSSGSLIAFFILYGLVLLIAGIFLLPWFITSSIYILTQREKTFSQAVSDSWRFFRKNTGVLWGYIGTVVLIEIGAQIIGRISSLLGGLLTLVVGPFFSVLGIVWVLTLLSHSTPNPPNYYSTPVEEPPDPFTSNPYSSEQWISPEKIQPMGNPSEPAPITPTAPITSITLTTSTIPDVSEPETQITPTDPSQENPVFSQRELDRPNFCPSCGRANTGTAYCPQCGTKL